MESIHGVYKTIYWERHDIKTERWLNDDSAQMTPAHARAHTAYLILGKLAKDEAGQHLVAVERPVMSAYLPGTHACGARPLALARYACTSKTRLSD